MKPISWTLIWESVAVWNLILGTILVRMVSRRNKEIASLKEDRDKLFAEFVEQMKQLNAKEFEIGELKKSLENIRELAEYRQSLIEALNTWIIVQEPQKGGKRNEDISRRKTSSKKQLRGHPSGAHRAV